MDVLVQKLNSGVELTPKGRGAVRSGKVTAKGRRAVAAAWDSYTNEVWEAFERAGIAKTGYAEKFWNAYPRFEGRSAFVALEPWGFAKGSYDNPTMRDTGSSPTPGRARHLLAYQAPLRLVKRNGGTYLDVVYKTDPG
jgi:hypothetical protein